MDAAEELKTLIAHDKVRACIVRLARGEDRRDVDLITASHWPDSISDFGVFRGTFDAYVAWVVPGSPAILATQHMLGQTFIELEGESALAETQVISYHRIDMDAEHRDVSIGGRYLDRLETRGGEWRIVERTMLYDWCQDSGRSADWSQGLMGMPLSAQHFTGRAVGDYSELFFGKRGETDNGR